MHIGMIMFKAGLSSGITALLVALTSNVTIEEQAVVTAVSYILRSTASVVSLEFSGLVCAKGIEE